MLLHYTDIKSDKRADLGLHCKLDSYIGSTVNQVPVSYHCGRQSGEKRQLRHRVGKLNNLQAPCIYCVPPFHKRGNLKQSASTVTDWVSGYVGLGSIFVLVDTVSRESALLDETSRHVCRT